MNKKKLIIESNLSVINKKKLLKHSEHHTIKHLKFMIQLIKKGSTFRNSHIQALKIKGI